MSYSDEILIGLPLKEKVKRLVWNKYRDVLSELQHSYSNHKEILAPIINYFLNGVLLGVSVYLLMSLKYNHSWLRLLGTIICTTTFIVYGEFYYKWFRRDWKQNN